jgi:hypothetical protein
VGLSRSSLGNRLNSPADGLLSGDDTVNFQAFSPWLPRMTYVGTPFMRFDGVSMRSFGELAGMGRACSAQLRASFIPVREHRRHKSSTKSVLGVFQILSLRTAKPAFPQTLAASVSSELAIFGRLGAYR